MCVLAWRCGDLFGAFIWSELVLSSTVKKYVQNRICRDERELVFFPAAPPPPPPCSQAVEYAAHRFLEVARRDPAGFCALSTTCLADVLSCQHLVGLVPAAVAHEQVVSDLRRAGQRVAGGGALPTAGLPHHRSSGAGSSAPSTHVGMQTRRPPCAACLSCRTAPRRRCLTPPCCGRGTALSWQTAPPRATPWRTWTSSSPAFASPSCRTLNWRRCGACRGWEGSEGAGTSQ